MTLEERLAHHKQMAESYHAAYLKQTVQEGATYEEWQFAPHATYWSPYFGDRVIDLDHAHISVQASATMEAASYGITLPDWGPLSFESWASEDGFVMKTHFGGHDKDGLLHDFFAYGFIKTDDQDRITHWETHVSPEYNDFLDFTLGVHGPFKNGEDEYMAAVAKRLAQAGLDLTSLFKQA